MRLEDYQSYSEPVFSRSTKIAIGILVIVLVFAPINFVPLGERVYRGSLSLYTMIVDTPQELVETYLLKKLNLHFTYNENDPARILQKQQHQGWLLKNWLFWGPFFVFMFPLSLLFCIGFIRKVKDILSRSRLLESHEGALLWEIKDKVRRVSWRINFFNWEKAFIYALIMGLILFTGQFAAQFFVNLSLKMMQSLLLSFLIYTVGIYTFYLYYNRFSQKQVAEIIDSRMGLKERLVTSMEEPRIPTPLYSVVLEETSQELRQQDMESLAPHRFPHPNKKGLLGMLLSTLFLAILISAATPHAAIMAKSYHNYIKEFSQQEKKQKINKVEKTIRQEGKMLKELVDEFESDSVEVKFFLEETSHLAQQMSSLDVDKMEISMEPSQSSKSDSLSDAVSPEEEQPKKTKRKRNKEYGKEVKISKRSLSIEANQYHRRNNKDFSQISGELSEIAMEMFKERKNIPNNHKNFWRKNFHRKDLINNLQGVEEFQEDNFDGNTDDEGAPDENSDEVDNFVQEDSLGSGKTDTFGEKQKDGELNTFSLESLSRVKEEKNRLQKKKIDIQTLKSLMEKIFVKKEEKQQATEKKKGEQVDQKNTPEQQIKAKLEKKSLNNLLDQTPSIFRQQKPRNNQKDKLSQTKPSSHDQTLHASPKETKEKTTKPQSSKKKSVHEFPTNYPNRKNVVILDNPRNIEIAKETFEDIPDEDADWYLQDWIRDSEDTLPSFTNIPVREDNKRSVVLGKKVDILYKNFLVINNPSNIKDPRPEMRDAVVSVNSPNFIRGLPKKLSRFVKDVTDPKKIEGLTSQLNKLGKDLDDWERANTPETDRYRHGTSQQKVIGVQANLTDDRVEIGNYNPMSNKDATVIRGRKIGRSMNDPNEKFRLEEFPEHLSSHQNMTNISRDLANLGRELIDIEKVQRQAILGREETFSDSISTDNRKDMRNKLEGKLNKKGRQFKGLGNKLEQLTDPGSLQAFAEKMADQSEHLGNMLLGFAQSTGFRETTSSTKGNRQVQNTLKENKKVLQEMAEQIRDREFTGYGSNFSSQLARLASKTEDLANQPSLSQSGDPLADDFIRKSLLQKAESIEQLTEDLRQRNPKGNREMARRFSKLAREMENLNQGFEKGKSIGKKSELDTIRKGLQQKGKKVELLSEEIKQGKEPMRIKEMASQLSQATEEMVDLQMKFGKYSGKQPALNRSQNKLSLLKDIDRKIRQQTNPKKLQKLANQMGEVAQDFKFSLDAQTAITQELDETNRQYAKKLVGKKSELDMIQKELQQKGKKVELLSEEIKQGKEPIRIKEMASQLSQATEEMVDFQKKLGKYPGKQPALNRSQNKLSLLKDIDRKIRQQTNPKKIQKLANQMGEVAQDFKFSLDAQTAITQELDETNRHYAEKLVGKKSELDMIQKELQQKGKKLELLSEEIKQGKEPMRIKEMASQLSQATEEMADLQKKLGKYPGKQPALNRSQNKLSLLKDIDRKIRQQTNPKKIQKLANQMGEVAQDFKFSLDAQTAITQELDETNRQYAEKLGKKFLHLSKKMQQETDLKQLQKLAGQMTDASQAMRSIKNQPQAFTQDKKISEQLKLTGNQLTELAQYTKDSNLNLDKLVRKVDKSAKQFDRLLVQSKDMQKKYAPQMGKVAGKLEMVRQELKNWQNSGFQQDSMTQQAREYIRKQQAQLKDVAQRIKRDPAYLNQAAEKLQGISKEIRRTATDGNKELDKSAANRLSKSASQIKKLAEDTKQAAENQKLPVSELVKANEEAMKDTLKKIEKITKTISDNPIQARQKEKELAMSSLEMEKLSRLQSLLGVDQTASFQQQQKIKEAQDKLQNLNRELQRQTDPNKLRNLAQKTQQASKDLIAQQLSKNLLALSNNQSTQNQDDRSLSSAGWLKKMAEELSKNKNVATARRLSKDLESINRQLNPGNRSDSSKLSKVKEKLDNLITKIGYDRRQQIDREALQAKLSQKINKLAQEIQPENNPKKLAKLSSQLTQLANQTGEMAQDLKFSLNAQTATSQKFIETNRQHAEKLGKQFLQLSKEMPQETSLKELRELADQMTDASQAKQSIKNQPHVSAQDKRISEQLELTGNQLSELAKYTKNNNLNLDKLVRKVDKSVKQLDQLTAQSKDMQKKYAPKIDKVADKLGMIRQELKRQQRSNSPQELMTQQTREYIRKQKAQLKDVAQRIQQDPTNLKQAAEELQGISEEIIRTTASGKKKLDKNATNRLNKSASQIKKLAGDVKQVAENQKIPVSELVKTSEEAMKDTMKKIEKITKTISNNPSQASQKGKELAASSLEMEKLSRLLSLLGVDRTASLQQQQKIKESRDKLQKLSKELQRQTDPNKLRNLAQKTQQVSKDLIALSKNHSTQDQPELAGDVKQVAENLKIPVSELIKTSEAAMKDTMKKIEKITKTISDNPSQASQKGKELAASSLEMEKLSRLLGIDRTASLQQQQKIKEARDKLKQLSKELQRQTDPNKLQNLAQKTQQVSKDLIALSKNQSTQDQPDRSLSSARWLKEMAEKLSKNKDVTTARSLSKSLDNMILQHDPGSRNSSSKLSRVKEKLDNLITEIDNDRRQLTNQEAQQAELSQKINNVAQDIQRENNPKKLEKLSSQLTQLANQMSNQVLGESNDTAEFLSKNLKQALTKTQQVADRLSEKIKKRLNSKKIKEEAKELDRQAEKTAKLILIEKERNLKSRKLQKDIEKTVWHARKISQKIQEEKEAQNLKKYTAELNKVSEQIVVMTMGMNNSSGKRSLKESIREIVKNTGESLQKITKRLDKSIEMGKVSSDLMKLSRELSNLDLGGKKKTESEENITALDKKIINETANKLKELSYKAKSMKNPKDVRQMATDLFKLSGNLENLDMGKSEQQGTKSTSTVVGQNRNPRTNKLKQLAKQLQDTSNISQTKIIAAQMSKLVTKLSKQDMKQSYKTAGENRKKRQENSESFFKKILDLPQFFSQDKKIKEQKNKSTNNHDQNDMTRTAAVNKIDKLIKKLKRKKKKLPGVYNSRQVLKKAGVSSKGTGNVQKGMMGKMSHSNYNMAKFTDSDVSKDVSTLPNTDIINNTYVMEKNLTDRQVFERIIKRLEKNREHILAEGKTPNKVMPSKKLPLVKDYQVTPHKPTKQPIEGSDSRLLAGLGVPDTVKIPKDPPVEEKPSPKIPNKSYMEKEKHTASMKVSIKMDKKDTTNLPKDSLKKRTQREPSQFNEYQAEDDSVIGQNIPGEYQDIIRELYTEMPESY